MGGESGFQLAGSAPERYEEFLAPVMAPFVDALVDAARVRTGGSVLDVACGTGFVARAAALRVGPTGRVVGVDVNPGMLDVASRAAPAVKWEQAPADRLPFADGEFDAVLCQQGLQFFSDMEAAVNEMARVTRPGGRIAVTVWSPLPRSPYMEAQYRAVSEILGAEASASFLDAFACSPDTVSAAFRAAGLHDIDDREVVATIHVPSPDRFLAGHLSALPWGAAIAEKQADGLRLAVDSMKGALDGDIDSGGSLGATFASVLVSGVR